MGAQLHNISLHAPITQKSLPGDSGCGRLAPPGTQEEERCGGDMVHGSGYCPGLATARPQVLVQAERGTGTCGPTDLALHDEGPTFLGTPSPETGYPKAEVGRVQRPQPRQHLPCHSATCPRRKPSRGRTITTTGRLRTQGRATPVLLGTRLQPHCLAACALNPTSGTRTSAGFTKSLASPSSATSFSFTGLLNVSGL